MPENDLPNNNHTGLSTLQKSLIAVILLSAFTGIVIGLMRTKGIDSSALMYIGIPTFLALAFATTSTSKTIVGSTLRAITFIILISGPLLQEGYICMLMAAPILYIVGALAAWPFDHYRKKKKNESRLSAFIILPILVVMSMEGVIDETSFNRFNTVEHIQVLDGNVADIKKRLAANRPLHAPDSLFANLFPQPDMIRANGLSIGDKQSVEISYYKWIYWNEKRGKVQFEVTENKDNYIKFQHVSDNSYISSYMTWKDTTVSFQPISEHQTKVTWRISFQRDIDPIWYVQPLQQYAVSIVAKVLVDSLQ